MSFTANGINLGIPSGVIVASAAHTTDPDGYVIADGVERTYDAKYNNLINLGIGSGNANSVVPPSASLSYQFEGNANDSAGSSNGTLVGTATYSTSVFARGSQSLFSNINSYITIPSLSLNTFANGLSIAFRFNRTFIDTQTVLNLLNASGTSQELKIYFFGNGTSYNLYMKVFTTQTLVTLNSNTSNTWIHAAITLTHSTNSTSICKIYINGSLSATSTASMRYPSAPYTTNTVGSFDGYLDNFNIYNSVLTQNQIYGIFGYTPPNLKASFLRAAGSQTVSSISYTGPTIENYQHNAIQSHTHPGSADAHTHTTASTAGDNFSRTPGAIGMGVSDGESTESNTTNPNDNNEVNVLSIKDVAFVNASAQSITVSNAGNDTKETAPFCYGVNWLIKL